ncbi:hypothetical protein L0A91_05730 [Ornithinimicrobium sp. INDO-MA30-4]|nr:hypothetical protein [Ornithinimicrobium sp. INDO-MA30-4]UJH71281.1 hypothetical protein L0A91_05730 [Ornithinimicrobium sp. INDO-MA30-4]
MTSERFTEGLEASIGHKSVGRVSGDRANVANALMPKRDDVIDGSGHRLSLVNLHEGIPGHGIADRYQWQIKAGDKSELFIL